ncbi:carbohydrate ABC transporter permease [Dongia sedimenti]|uniref:Sugar ABC transporter permease n=1 Tax=Dongia sedimenti TaxID=3064282 RepID=A0ABU0YTP3_9PROT|nr:sugar ABC transporter permease [Rhodospirillaceae bacterium R-7]
MTDTVLSDQSIPGQSQGLFRVRQITDNVEARPVPSIATEPKLNPPASRAYFFGLMAPAIALLACISLYPFCWLIYMSLHDVEIGSAVWNNFENFTKLASDSRYLNGWWLLIQYSVMCLALQIGIGVFLAVALNGARFEKILVTTLLMPMMMAPIVAGLVWYFLYNGTFGWYHWLLQSVGILGPKSILASTGTALIGIVIVDVWQWTPLITLITLAGLKRVPQDQLEANMVDGASQVRNFFAITLPNLYPVLVIAVMLRFMDNFRFIDSVLALTGGGPGNATKILPVYLFEVSFKFFKLGRGAAIALTLLVVTIILGMILVRVFDRQQTRKA